MFELITVNKIRCNVTLKGLENLGVKELREQLCGYYTMIATCRDLMK